MRWAAQIGGSCSGVARAMVAEQEGGALLFLYHADLDGPCQSDLFFDTVKDVKKECLETFNIREDDWRVLPDQILGCQQDWIAPVRIKKEGKRGETSISYEQLINGAWLPFE